MYRLLLFLVTVYAGSQVIGIMYRPDEPVNPWESLFHVFLFIGSLLAKPEYFPGNCK